MPAYSGMITRTSSPCRRSAFGRAPTTSPRPPVLANGAHSDVTKRTFNGGTAGAPPWLAASRRVGAIVQLWKEVVLRLDVREPRLGDPILRQLAVETVEAQYVLVHPAGGVRHGRPGAHDERPVAALHEHELARRLIESARGERVGRRMAMRQLHHALPGHVEMAVDPRVALVEPVLVVPLPAPRRGGRSRHLVGRMTLQVVAGADRFDRMLVVVELAEEIAEEDRPFVPPMAE